MKQLLVVHSIWHLFPMHPGAQTIVVKWSFWLHPSELLIMHMDMKHSHYDLFTSSASLTRCTIAGKCGLHIYYYSGRDLSCVHWFLFTWVTSGIWVTLARLKSPIHVPLFMQLFTWHLLMFSLPTSHQCTHKNILLQIPYKSLHFGKSLDICSHFLAS